jgi:hypothetical protein
LEAADTRGDPEGNDLASNLPNLPDRDEILLLSANSLSRTLAEAAPA